MLNRENYLIAILWKVLKDKWKSLIQIWFFIEWRFLGHLRSLWRIFSDFCWYFEGKRIFIWVSIEFRVLIILLCHQSADFGIRFSRAISKSLRFCLVQKLHGVSDLSLTISFFLDFVRKSHCLRLKIDKSMRFLDGARL
jgi:hypothetical protein